MTPCQTIEAINSFMAANPKAYPDISLKLAKEVEAMQGGVA